MTKSFLNSQLLDVIEILASFTLNITYSNRVNGQEQLISTQPTSFCSNHLETYSRSPIYLQTVKQHKFFKESYELATKLPFGHLLIDLDPKTSDSLSYCSNIVQPGPTIFYLPSSKAVITNLTDERERVMYAKANARAV